MATSTRQLLYNAVMTRLRGITIGGGYNTQPAVVADYLEAMAGQETYSLWLTMAPETVSDVTINAGRETCDYVLAINGLIRESDVGLANGLNLLLQDVRNAIHASASSYGTDANGASLIQFQTCETDEGTLADEGKAFVRQLVLFRYLAGPTW